MCFSQAKGITRYKREIGINFTETFILMKQWKPSIVNKIEEDIIKYFEKHERD